MALVPMPVNPLRIRTLANFPLKKGPVIYWMSRDQRVHDNWALLYAQELALLNQQPLAVAFCLVPDFLQAGARQYRFMLQGLHEVKRSLEEEAQKLFLPRGRTQSISLHVNAYTEARQKGQQASLSSREWVEHDTALREARSMGITVEGL